MNSVQHRVWRRPAILSARFAIALLLVWGLASQVRAQELPTIAVKTTSMRGEDGFIPIYYDSADGRLYLEISLPGEEFLYNSFMASDAGLAYAMGMPNWNASEQVVRFERRGSQVFLNRKQVWIQKPEGDWVRAASDAPFLPFLPGSFPIVAEEGGRVLVDGTDYFVRDVSGRARQGIGGVPARLSQLYGEEKFHFDRERSSIYRPATRSTPRSTEVEVSLTFVTDHPGTWATKFFPDPSTFIVRERHSLRPLPADGIEVRHLDPRMGSGWPIVFRWRLEKRDPLAAVSDVVRPLEFYLDPALPPSVHKASKRGIEYWNTVFEHVGFRNAIEIRDFPPDADPLDPEFPIVVRWRPAGMISQGVPYVDPRTNEAVKAVIFVDGYQEKRFANTFRAFQSAFCPDQPNLETVLLTVRTWLVAHEAGHVLGFAHNDIVPSVVAIHRPRLRVQPAGCVAMDLSVVVSAAPFPYDEWRIRYAYAPLPAGHEVEGLRRIVEEGLRSGLRPAETRDYFTNPRGRPRIHSLDPLVVLNEDMAVRRLVLRRFGADMLQPGEPQSLLFERLIPVYFHHRHSLGAVVMMLGGVDFTYDQERDFQRVDDVVDARDQRRALEAILHALSPEELQIPPSAAKRVPARLASSALSELEWPVRKPGVFMYITDTAPLELPLPSSGPFDPLGWADVLSRGIANDLLDGERLARVATQFESGQIDLSVGEAIDRVVAGTWGAPTPADTALAPLRRVARNAILDGLLSLARDENTMPSVREPVRAALARLLADLRGRVTVDPAERTHLDRAIERIGAVD